MFDLAAPVQVIGVGCEGLFAIHNRLEAEVNAGRVHVRFSDTIWEELVVRFVRHGVVKQVFQQSRPFPLDELRTIFNEWTRDPSLEIDGSDLGKLFTVAVMSLKAIVFRIVESLEMIKTLERKLSTLAGMTTNPHTKDEIKRLRGALEVFYGSRDVGAISRARYTVLTEFRCLTQPVKTLIREGMQLDSGHLVPRVSPQNVWCLGESTSFIGGGSTTGSSSLPIAKGPTSLRRVLRDVDAPDRDNLFSADRDRDFPGEHGSQRSAIPADEADLADAPVL